jgi:hypothetical protein
MDENQSGLAFLRHVGFEPLAQVPKNGVYQEE